MATDTKTKADNDTETAEVVEPTYGIEDILDNLPGVQMTQGNRDGELLPVEPESAVRDWMEYRPGADKVVEDVLALFPEDIESAVQHLTIIATYETGDANSWSDAAQAAGIADVGKRNGPEAARSRYEKVVPNVNGNIKGATKVGRHHRAKYSANVPAPEATEDE